MRSLSVIWDITAHCPWNCAICCMGATHETSCRNSELTLSEKLDVVDQIKELRNVGIDVRTDLSGGEIFTNIDDHTKVIKALSDAIGKDKVGISCSGYKIDEELAKFLSKTVHDVEMTMDTAPCSPYALRPIGYSIAAARAVKLLKAAGCPVGLQTVVGSYNNSYTRALAVYAWACDNHVDNWSILRFFPSGRGADYPEAVLNDEQCEEYVHMVQQMSASIAAEHKPEVDFHYLMPGHSKYSDVCRCVRHSIGILPNGDVVACFWALDSRTGAVDSKFLLGNVRESSLAEVLNSEKAHYWSDCEHCCELDQTNTGGDFYDVLSA